MQTGAANHSIGGVRSLPALGPAPFGFANKLRLGGILTMLLLQTNRQTTVLKGDIGDGFKKIKGGITM